MIRKILSWVNYALLAVAALLILWWLLLVIRPNRVISPPSVEEAPVGTSLPPSSFDLSAAAYDTIGPPVLTVSIPPPTFQLPDLRPHLNYYGTNERPDIPSAATMLHFSLKGTDSLATVMPGEPLYLQYDGSARPGRYVFSSDNDPSSLWITAEPGEGQATVIVHMKDEEGAPVTEPKTREKLVLKTRDFSRFSGEKWEIGKWRVDGTLLARQRARWMGQDLFMNAHGGEEYADIVGKERIEFGEKDQQYVVYVGEGDCLIWDGERWQTIKPGEGSRDYPLMCVKKIEDRLMRLELWDVGGKGRVMLNLVRSREAWNPKSLERDFKFLSTRTLSQYVFEVKKERVVLRPFDWLLQKEKDWVSLSTVEEIDAYVQRQTPGVLFVFQGPAYSEEGRQVLRGTFYSPSRTNKEVVDWPLDQSPLLGPGLRSESPRSSARDNEESSEQEEGEENSDSDTAYLLDSERVDVSEESVGGARFAPPLLSPRQPGRLSDELKTTLDELKQTK